MTRSARESIKESKHMRILVNFVARQFTTKDSSKDVRGVVFHQTEIPLYGLRGVMGCCTEMAVSG
jgi:hypothetical protein